MTVAYEGWVRHRRFQPVEHAFRYPLAMSFVDLDEPPARFRCDDYLAREAVIDLVGEQTGRRPAGPVRLLTQPRQLGYAFNPVSFYFCYDGEHVAAVVAEVTNTPWRERHAYVLERGPVRKALYVSPFLAMDGEYRWSVSEPGATLRIHIALGHAFDATLALRRRERSRRALVRSSPLVVTARIYLQALRLRLKGVPVQAR